MGLRKQLVQHQLSSVQETSRSPSQPLRKARVAAIIPFLAQVAFTEDGFQPPLGPASCSIKTPNPWRAATLPQVMAGCRE